MHMKKSVYYLLKKQSGSPVCKCHSVDEMCRWTKQLLTKDIFSTTRGCFLCYKEKHQQSKSKLSKTDEGKVRYK